MPQQRKVSESVGVAIAQVATAPLLSRRLRRRAVLRLIDSCEPNKTGGGHHDDKTGHPCSPDGGASPPLGDAPRDAPHTVISPDESNARKALAAWMKSDERKKIEAIQGTKAVKKKDAELTGAVYDHLRKRLAPHVDAADKLPPHVDLKSAKRHIDGLKSGDYVSNGSGRIGIVVRTAVPSHMPNVRGLSHENSIRWLDTRAVESTHQMKPEVTRKIRGIGVNEADARSVAEGCIPNKSGKGHHDDKTGHPCSPTGGTGATPKQKADARRKAAKSSKRGGPKADAGATAAKGAPDGKGGKATQSKAAHVASAMNADPRKAAMQAANPMKHPTDGPEPSLIDGKDLSPEDRKRAVEYLSSQYAATLGAKVQSGGAAVASGAATAASTVNAALPKWAQGVTGAVAQEVGFLYNLGMMIHHKLEMFRDATMNIAVTAAKERGLKPERVDNVKHWLKASEAVSLWTAWVPADVFAHENHIHGLAHIAIVKGSGLVPVASAAYLAYSTARNPLATWRAAVKVFRGHGALSHKHHEAEDDKVSKASILGLVDRAGDQLGDDWYQALLAVALDKTHGNLGAALDLADKMHAKHPAPSGV